ncbi:MAG TPA: transglycosylase SLT domain-containing protein [Candidatus Cybelea sp.]|nr:transglycosylase SLT domain-containing protein [Candidatus Cybelea sp.]
MKTGTRLALIGGVVFSFLAPSASARGTGTRAREAAAARTIADPKYLEELSRELKDEHPGSAYQKLSVLAERKPPGVLGARAALALGYFDYSNGQYARAAKWLERAQQDPLLRDYAVYWSAENELAQGHGAEAVAEFKQFRQEFPDSVMTEQALEALGDAAIAANQPGEAVAALDAYPGTADRPALLFLRGEAHEQAGEKQLAAADYEAVYFRFAASEQAREAGTKLDFLSSTPGVEIPAIPIDQQKTHADILFEAKDWADARNEYSKILLDLNGVDAERARLRIIECAAQMASSPTDLAALQLSDPDVDAERFYSLAQIYRSLMQDSEMSAAVEAAVARAPQSRWTALALMTAGNEFWVELDRDRAAGFYKRLEEGFPTSPEATPAEWRVAWVSVLKRQPEASDLLTEHIHRFPTSPFVPDALYWLGRLSEEAAKPALARSYYEKLAERFPENYFETAADARLRVLGQGASEDPNVLAEIPPPPAVPKMSDAVSAAARERKARADALRSIAFDDSAELELRAAYAATGDPRLLLEAAQAAVDAGHLGEAIVAVRQVFPQLESRPFANVPREVWLTAYAMPFKSSIRLWSTRAGVDPMLVAGLIRQESAFEREAHSNRNAMGLMQLEPKTARLMAHESRIRYSDERLFDPDYNVRLGTMYLAGLRKQFGSVESALAAYNAGEDRVTAWTAGQTYREPAEFVDSIPFTETREYVEIVSRNAEIYHRLYGEPDEPRRATIQHRQGR